MVERVSVDALPATARIARIHVDQYHRMMETGILREGDPIELLDGMLVYKDRSARGEDPMTIGKHHNLVIKLLARLDSRLGTVGCHMQPQGPLALSPHHEPEPDGAIVRGQPRDYADHLPTAAEVSCVIEVADSSLAHDRTTKLQGYAAAGIPQYVIVNLVDLKVEVYERPLREERSYETLQAYAADESISLLAGSERLSVPARELLP